MKRILCIVILVIFSIRSFSEEIGISYRNLNLNINTHEATLATSEKVMPVYTELKYNFKKDRRVSPFFKGDMGFFYVEDMEDTHDVLDIKDNGYYSMGAGLDINYLSVELAYIVYKLGYIKNQEEVDEGRMLLRFKYRY